MNGFFITGTDTDAGKTVLLSLLLGAFNSLGYRSLPMKPAQSGCENNTPDLDYALSIAGLNPTKENLSLMAPACYAPACSPHLAAEIENRPVDIDIIMKSFAKLKKQSDMLLVEGAGGIMVPLNREVLMIDLMKKMKLPVIIASRPGLGTINHTLLSVKSLQRNDIEIAGIVFVHTHIDSEDFTTEDNKKTIFEFGSIPIIGSIPYEKALESVHPPKFDDLPFLVTHEVLKVAKRISK